MLNAELTPEDITCLDEFDNMRSSLMREMGRQSESKNDELQAYRSNDAEDVGTHELLIAEVRNESDLLSFVN